MAKVIFGSKEQQLQARCSKEEPVDVWQSGIAEAHLQDMQTGLTCLKKLVWNEDAACLISIRLVACSA